MVQVLLRFELWKHSEEWAKPNSTFLQQHVIHASMALPTLTLMGRVSPGASMFVDQYDL